MSIFFIVLASIATLIIGLLAYGMLIAFNRQFPALQLAAQENPENRGHMTRVHIAFWMHIAIWGGLGYTVYLIWAAVL